MSTPNSDRIGRGVEVLVKKASVDPAFRNLLIERRAAAADEIELPLDPAEAMMLEAVTVPQLEAIIARTTVPQEHRRAFLGKAAAAMLAAIGLAVPGYVGCAERRQRMPAPGGARPDGPYSPTKSQPDSPGAPP